MRTELFMYFCIKKYIGTQGELCRLLKICLTPPPVVYTADRSKVVVVFFLFCVALWFILRALHILKSSRALCPRVSSFILALRSPRLGKRELVCVLLVQLFVCFVRVSFGHVSLPLGVGDWLRFMIVALPGFFYYFFKHTQN